MSSHFPRIAVVGASGAVGMEAISILESRDHPINQLKLFGSDRSSGSSISYLDSAITIQHLDDIAKNEYDFVLLCATSVVAQTVRNQMKKSDAVLIDNSSAFRMDPDVSLVIPEVNVHLLNSDTRLVANPNCSTIMLLTALNPLRVEFGIRNVIVTTYQAVSGAGTAGISELLNQSRAYLNDEHESAHVFPCSSAFNVFEHESAINPETGFNGEESKLINETRRIWNDPGFSILPTCVRVPVERAHSQSVIIELDQPTKMQEIRDALSQTGIVLLPEGYLLTPREAARQDDVFVGRIRIDPQSGGKRVLIWICADQIRKGAALNAIQILDAIQLERDSVSSQ